MAAITRLGSSGYGTRRNGSFAGKASHAHPVGVITRLGSGGYGARRCGSFAGKGGGGTHPVDAITRLGTGGYGVRRAGSFAGKASGSAHPVGRITRLGTAGYGVRRAGSFGGKTSGAVTPPEPPAVQGPFGHVHRQPFRQRATLYPFDRPDEYGELRARQGVAPTQRAQLQAFAGVDEAELLQAHSTLHVELAAALEQEPFGELVSKRGLPSLDVLTFFLSVISKH